MIKISEIKETASEVFHTELQKRTYQTLCELKIPFHRVDTDKIITMEDCEAVNERLQMNMVKTLFLCNHRQTEFYLFIIMPGNKRFKTKLFSSALNISRVSFAPSEKMEEMLETSIGAVLIIGGVLWGELRRGDLKHLKIYNFLLYFKDFDGKINI